MKTQGRESGGIEGCIRDSVRELAAGMVPDVYRRFDAFLKALAQCPQNEMLLERDCDIIVRDSSMPLYDDNLRPSCMTRCGEGWKMQGFHIMPGLPVDLPSLTHPLMDARIVDFYRLMDDFAQRAQAVIGPALAKRTGLARQWTVIGKVWRYRNIKASSGSGDTGQVFVPPHFDRSVFSIMLDSRLDFDGESRHLCLGAPDDAIDIDAVAARWDDDEWYMPEPHHYPIVIAGLHARDTLGLAPVPHSVLRMDPAQGDYRYSLLVFVVPRTGLQTSHRHMPTSTARPAAHIAR
ncbi:hypothetical protein KDW36_09185 [Burkholderia dolosa]|uniref:hypothetical protein n=1 Tax=Burkholderia dolosa TaxID=152500 RepID=UPI001B8F29DF|nr:hypothetical protein [Burkholderia dolosa]MBR8313371.1 hypothetical protein [Burkholderia dolosa]